ncbi:MAG: (d)CMP kinase [Bacteroidetes Order II. Incertae sedis bacterium]|nr:(d)CMP kinase [Bacteroidetes Order II. bacterium]
MIIAIDGPAGSGKSTTAKLVAKALGLLYLDTGAMYRAIAYACLAADLDIEDVAFSTFVEELELAVTPAVDEMQVWVSGQNVTSKIRTRQVTGMASKVATQAIVRNKLVVLQRQTAQKQLIQNGGVVLDGRDIGTVVFPEADLKIFLTADPKIRAKRRVAEMNAKGIEADFEAIRLEIESRDAQDSTRAMAPLRKAEDAIVLDTTALGIDEQVNRVIAEAKLKTT